MTLSGICAYLGYLRESVDSYLAIGNFEKAATLLEELKESNKRYFSEGLTEKQGLTLERKVKEAFENKLRVIEGLFDHKIYLKEWLIRDHTHTKLEHYGFSLHTNREKMLRYKKYKGWQMVREDSQREIQVNKGIFNLVKNAEGGDGDLFISHFDSDFKHLYKFILKEYGEVYNPKKD